MIAHTMKYVALAENVADELDPDSLTRAQLKDIARELTERESALVRAYREFQDLLGRRPPHKATRAPRATSRRRHGI